MGSVEDVRAAELSRYAAMRRNDTTALAELLADHAVYAHSSGGTDTKDSYLERLADGGLVYLALKHTEWSVSAGERFGFVVGHMKADVVLDGMRQTLDNAYITVWINDESRWRLCGYQALPAGTVTGALVAVASPPAPVAP